MIGVSHSLSGCEQQDTGPALGAVETGCAACRERCGFEAALSREAVWPYVVGGGIVGVGIGAIGVVVAMRRKVFR